MASDVIEENEVVVCPHCGERVVLRVSTNVYGIGEFGKPNISVDEERSREKPVRFDYRGRIKQ